MAENMHIKVHGAWIIFISAIIGFIISIFNFFLPSSDIRHSGGAELVIVTTFMIAALGVVFHFFRHIHARWERISLYLLLIILVLGTLFAAILLESWLLSIVMFVTLLGWFIQIYRG